MTQRLLTTLAIICMFGMAVNADTVYLTADDATTAARSYDTAGNWDNSQAPSAGNDYVNNGYRLRTYSADSGGVFAGDSLTLTGGGYIALSGYNEATYTVNNFIIDNGAINSYASPRTHNIAGDITIGNGGMHVDLGSHDARQDIEFQATLTGTGGLSLANRTDEAYQKYATLDGLATYLGSTAVGQYVTLNVNGSLLIDVNDGSNSDISGLGSLVLDSALRLDVAGVTGNGSWNLIDVDDLTETYDDDFSVALAGGQAFTESSPGVWTLQDDGNRWEFDEGTGDLTLTPEPTTMILLAAGGLLLSKRRRV